MKVATIILHKLLTEEQRIAAVTKGEPLEVTVVNDYADTGRGHQVTFDMVSDHLQKGDERSANSLIDVHNIATYHSTKNKIQVKIVNENNLFTLSALQPTSPYADLAHVDNHNIRVRFDTVSGIQNTSKFDQSIYKLGIKDEISTEIKNDLKKKGVTIIGDKWNSFSVDGECYLYFQAVSNTTRFLGNNKEGFLILKQMVDKKSKI